MLLSVHSASATPFSAVNTQQNSKECSNRQIAFGWLFKPRAARATMGSICKEILTVAGADEVWSAVRDIGALHTRLVPGFVTDTRLESGARIVTFGNGMMLREPIIAVDDGARRRVWSAEGGPNHEGNLGSNCRVSDPPELTESAMAI